MWLRYNLPAVTIGGWYQGGRGATDPPDFEIYVFGPPRFQHQKLTNIGWKSLSQGKFFAIGLCGHSYVEFKELIHNPSLPIIFRPPQVVTCTSTSGNSKLSSTRAQHRPRMGDSDHLYSQLAACEMATRVW